MNLKIDLKKRSELILRSSKLKTQKIQDLVLLVQEVPYKRIGSLKVSDMLKAGQGSCTPKHVFFAQCLAELGIPSKFLQIPFYYKNLNIEYPVGHEKIVEDTPISYHTALKIQLEGKWYVIDVTWDPQLRGFPMTKDWDGESDMKLAVVPEEIIEIECAPDEFKKATGKIYSDEEKLKRKAFYKLFDQILEKARKNA